MEWKDQVLHRFSKSGKADSWHDMYDKARTFQEHNFQIRRDFTVNYLTSHLGQDAKILDLGCGAGPILEKLHLHNFEPFGVDYSFDMLTHAHDRISKNTQKNPCLIRSDCTKLPFETDNFDCVVCLGVISFVENPEDAIKEISRILKPNGLLIISVRNRLNKIYFDPIHFIKYLTKVILKPVIGKKPINDELHIGRFFHPKDVADILKSNHFNITDIKGIGLGPFRINNKKFLPEVVSVALSKLKTYTLTLCGLKGIVNHASDINIFVCKNNAASPIKPENNSA